MSDIKGCPMWQGTEPLSTPCYKVLCAWYTNDECAIASIARSLGSMANVNNESGEFRALVNQLTGGAS
ncbi:MAG: hypothetical protein IKF14_13775 [Atopobiaceae bacterium]|nr:hypothetical protein [Atopobiaceae bacterium]